MTFDAALVCEQGAEFAVVCVRRGVIGNPTQAAQTQASFSPHFGGVPVVLMEQDSSGRPTYYGRRDIVDFLANLSMDRLPWKKWHLN